MWGPDEDDVTWPVHTNRRGADGWLLIVSVALLGSAMMFNSLGM